MTVRWKEMRSDDIGFPSAEAAAHTGIRRGSADNYVLCLAELREITHQNSDTEERLAQKENLHHAVFT